MGVVWCPAPLGRADRPDLQDGQAHRRGDPMEASRFIRRREDRPPTGGTAGRVDVNAPAISTLDTKREQQ